MFQQETSHGIKDCIHCFLLLVITDGNHVLNLHRQAALGRQDLSCMHLTRHEVESVNIIIIIIIIIIVFIFIFVFIFILLLFFLLLLLSSAHAHVLDACAEVKSHCQQDCHSE